MLQNGYPNSWCAVGKGHIKLTKEQHSWAVRGLDLYNSSPSSLKTVSCRTHLGQTDDIKFVGLVELDILPRIILYYDDIPHRV
jgi:hypothetical protein